MKTCTICKLAKIESDFSFKNKKKGTRQSSCKECQSEAKKQDYINKKEQYKERSKLAKKRRTEYLIKIRSETPCSDCKNKFPYYVMEFDHIKDKKDNVTTLVNSSWNLMLAEIKKCEIVCANCHSIRTYKRRQGTQIKGKVANSRDIEKQDN